MTNIEIVDLLTEKMIEFDKGDARRIQHFLKVHRFAQLIGRREKLEEHTQLLLECAAVVHDVGIHPAEAEYGYNNGKLQEKFGPEYARPLLEAVGLPEADIERICYLVGHHHTYSGIDGADYQILVEADFLVNLFEDEASEKAIAAAGQKIFRTSAGKALLEQLYDVPRQRG